MELNNKNNEILKKWAILKISKTFLYVCNISKLHISNRVCELRPKDVKRKFWLTERIVSFLITRVTLWIKVKWKSCGDVTQPFFSFCVEAS